MRVGMSGKVSCNKCKYNKWRKSSYCFVVADSEKIIKDKYTGCLSSIYDAEIIKKINDIYRPHSQELKKPTYIFHCACEEGGKSYDYLVEKSDLNGDGNCPFFVKKKEVSIMAIILVSLGVLIPIQLFVYWVQNPGLTYMQVVLNNKGSVSIGLILIFMLVLYLRKKHAEDENVGGYKAVQEGSIKKGGVGDTPKTTPPPAPSGQKPVDDTISVCDIVITPDKKYITLEYNNALVFALDYPEDEGLRGDVVRRLLRLRAFTNGVVLDKVRRLADSMVYRDLVVLTEFVDSVRESLCDVCLIKLIGREDG